MSETLLDTNIFIRFFIKDIDDQFLKSFKIFEKIEKGELEGLISILVINEIIWILENYYELKREIYIPELLKLLALKKMKIVEVSKNLVIKILQLMQDRKIDFTDFYLSEISDTKQVLSFDKDFEKLKK